MSDNTGFPRAWRFYSDSGDADGAVFEGRFTGVIELGSTKDYGDKPVARFTHEGSGEEISIWLFQQALQDRLAKIAPKEGELVRIEHLGKKKSTTSSRSYQAFRVTAPERPVVALSWAELGASDDDGDE